MLVHLGRRDTQVKVLGHRIECAEIESHLLMHPTVSACVVRPFADRAGETCLSAYVVSSLTDAETFDQQLRLWLQNMLPAYAVPSVFIRLGALPFNDNGKVDRSRLPDAREALDQQIAARTAGHSNRGVEHENAGVRRIASLLSDLWQEILNSARPGFDDDFFQMGGDSLSGMQLCLELERRFQLNLPVASLFAHSTVRAQAHMLAGGSGTIHTAPLAALSNSITAHLPTLCCVPGLAGHAWMFRFLAHHLDGDVNVYGFNYPGLDTHERPMHNIQALATSYADELERSGASEHVTIGGYSMGGTIAFALASILEERGRQPQLLLLWDASLPVYGPVDRIWRSLRCRLPRVRNRRRSALEQQMQRVADCGRAALARYRPTEYAGRAVFYGTTSRLTDQANTGDPAGGWARYCTGELTARFFATEHIDLFRPPHVAAIADAVRADMNIQPQMTHAASPLSSVAPL